MYWGYLGDVRLIHLSGPESELHTRFTFYRYNVSIVVATSALFPEISKDGTN
jgi:hypothetical protein